MLQFVLGRAGSGKTSYLRNMLVDMSVSEPRKLMMIVPEQYSFETEKTILKLAGPVRANQVEILSFTRLAEMVFRHEGGVSGRKLSDSGRRILMSMAIDSCMEELRVYRRAAKSGKLIDTMLTAVNEMKMCKISKESLIGLSKSLPKAGLHDKLIELTMIYNAYNELVSSSFLDSRDELTRLAEVLLHSEFFFGYTVAIDAFEGFTAQEHGVIRQILRKADLLVVSLCMEPDSANDMGLFSLVARTHKKLTHHAQEFNIRIALSVVLKKRIRFQNSVIAHLEENIFRDEVKTLDVNHGLSLYKADDVFEESEYVAATIHHLVMKKGYQYRDFTVICRNPDRYYGSLDLSLKKRIIPCFISEAESVDTEPVMRFVLCAFEAVASSYTTEAILDLLKTGVAGMYTEEISTLENYVFVWNIRGKQWKEPFVKNPAGFGAAITKETDVLLKRINSLRERVIKPLEVFADCTRNVNAHEISTAVYKLLMKFEVDKNLQTFCSNLDSIGEEDRSGRQIRIWDLLMELLDQMVAVLKDEKISRTKYYQLLKEAIRGEDISEIPQVLDAVLFGTIEQVRQSAPKVVFVLGAVQGEFPMTPKAIGIFSDHERKLLIEKGLPLSDPLIHRAMEERYLAYSVLSLPSERLFVSYFRVADASEVYPSEIVDSIKTIFPNLKEKSDVDPGYFCNTLESTFTKMADCYRTQTPQSMSMKQIISESPDYKGKLQALERAAYLRPEKISSTQMAQDLFKGRSILSATQIESFYNCKFKYFCQYGMRALERKPAALDMVQYGTIMHSLFEGIFSQGVETVQGWEKPELRTHVDEKIKTYAEENMGGFDGISRREQYRLRRMAGSAVLIIEHVCEELMQSLFTPDAYELKLGQSEVILPLKIESAQGNTILVGGTIDRVDIYNGTDGRYVRVIDYKTGRKEFKLSDVLFGLNMQMLIYLAALADQMVLPAGILYMPSVSPVVSAEKGVDDTVIQKESDKQLRMNGLVLNDAEIIMAMEEGAKGRFIPVTVKNGEPSAASSVIGADELQTVMRYSKRLIATMADSLDIGEIEAKPAMVDRDTCAYCPYSSVCGREFTEKDVRKIKLKKQEILNQMQDAND